VGLLESAGGRGGRRLLSQSGTEQGDSRKVWPFARCTPANGALKRHGGAEEHLLA